MKIAVYTCIVGNYDTLKSHCKCSDTDFLVFSDVHNNGQIPITTNLSPRLTNRYYKIMWHKIPELLKYDFTVYIDGNISIKKDIKEFVEKYLEVDIGLFPHPNRNCIYDEGNACVKYHKAGKEEVEKQLEGYRNEGYPRGYGLNMGGVILRSKPTQNSIKLCESWFDEVSKKVCRDQLSFNYCVWKYNLRYSNLNKDDRSYFFDIPKGFRHVKKRKLKI